MQRSLVAPLRTKWLSFNTVNGQWVHATGNRFDLESALRDEFQYRKRSGCSLGARFACGSRLPSVHPCVALTSCSLTLAFAKCSREMGACNAIRWKMDCTMPCFNTVNGQWVHATQCPGALAGQALKMEFWSTLNAFFHFRHFRTWTSFRFSRKSRLLPFSCKAFRRPRRFRSGFCVGTLFSRFPAHSTDA